MPIGLWIIVLGVAVVGAVASFRTRGGVDPDDAPVFARKRADVWFRDEATAAAAGFVPWDAHRR